MKTRLKELRRAAGWSNADDFAAYVGMPAKTYRNYEQGSRGLNLQVASDLCNALGCSVNDLIIEDAIEQQDVTEADLLSCFQNMDTKGREVLLAIARDLEQIFPTE